ncbi:FAD-dependent oxidoreductase [Sulfurimonas sp.]|uniref:FAD-dependent oxidoreductase n=1 Tax=Sulfurimonas sp. TaxID=2022749 RepID=UPI002B472557|nr:FAD-dependent oxidoreductase [Sulfurimonas sp.]
MNINRRDALKMGAVSVVAAATALSVTGCGKAEAVPAAACSNKNILGKHQVVIIGGGFGGLTVAKNLKKKDKNIDVLVIEKNDTFMSCPFSNAYLGKLDGVNLGTFVHDYAQPTQKYGYGMLRSEVVSINAKAKEVTTAHGVVGYDTLVLSPGIAYNYEQQFPTFSKEKIAEIQRTAPGALIPGSEHVILERSLSNMEDGDVVITVPSGKFRCPPAPFERACMIASYMKKEDIQGKVIILNPSAKIAKGAAFKEAWKELYGNRIIHMDNCKIDDVDVNGKSISFTQQVSTGKKDSDGLAITKAVKKSHKYEVLNLIPNNKANAVVAMSGVATTQDSFGKVLMNGCSFRTKSDENIYAVGDVVGHGIPPSGQTAVWAGKQCADEIVNRIQKKSFTLAVKSKSVTAGNVCYSMVGDNPEEAIMVTHDFSWTGKIIKGKGNVPKAPSGKFRSKGTAKATRDWYSGIMRDLFS